MITAVQGHVMNNYGWRDVTMARGEGMYLYDTDGRQYLDFTAGIAVCSLGHAHPAVSETLARQAGTLLHCSNLYLNVEQNRLASRLAELSGLSQVFFCNSGTEANEAAMKLARKYQSGHPGKTRLISLPGGFHGRTFGSLSLTAKEKYQAGFRPLVPECNTPLTMDEVVKSVDEQTAACFVEVIQGEGGVVPVSTEQLLAIQRRCREVGALLVIDEVQTGVGRTGTFFAYEQVGLQPDIVTMAKALGNGVPIGAVLARSEVAAALTPGSHGSTFGGNPLVCAVANTVLDVVTEEGFLTHVNEVGEYLGHALETVGQNVCGRGLMWGMSVPDAATFVKSAAEHGVLLTALGEHRVRFVPPLIAEHCHVDELMSVLTDIH